MFNDAWPLIVNCFPSGTPEFVSHPAPCELWIGVFSFHIEPLTFAGFKTGMTFIFEPAIGTVSGRNIKPVEEIPVIVNSITCPCCETAGAEKCSPVIIRREYTVFWCYTVSGFTFLLHPSIEFTFRKVEVDIILFRILDVFRWKITFVSNYLHFEWSECQSTVTVAERICCERTPGIWKGAIKSGKSP